jgi:hypothetical protein
MVERALPIASGMPPEGGAGEVAAVMDAGVADTDPLEHGFGL